jgi:deoxyribonuclease V
MIACTDTHYGAHGSRTSLILFDAWSDGVAAREVVQEGNAQSAEYVPGQLFLRELPHILSALKSVRENLETIVIDGYVWLDPNGRKGLGAHLYEALNGTVNVIGVAKNRFSGSAGVEVFRGKSRNPLVVTAASMHEAEAAEHIRAMHGVHRIPTLLKRADYLSRHGLAGASL